MGDPRNVAHDKKVIQEKHHKGTDIGKGAVHAPQPGKKTQLAKKKQPVVQESSVVDAGETAKPEQKTQSVADPAQVEKSLVVLSKLKELEFHSRANIEKLAELSLTIEEELKQKAFVEPIGALYSAQDAFQSQILKLIDAYEAECARLKPPG
jgi:hypothetical protein